MQWKEKQSSHAQQLLELRQKEEINSFVEGKESLLVFHLTHTIEGIVGLYYKGGGSKLLNWNDDCTNLTSAKRKEEKEKLKLILPDADS